MSKNHGNFNFDEIDKKRPCQKDNTFGMAVYKRDIHSENHG